MCNIYRYLLNLSESIGSRFQDVALLFMRVYLASVFLKSGVQKLMNWDSTKLLFEFGIYKVPLLSPEVAATLGAIAEISLPLLIIFGIFTRLSAFALFFFNIVAVLSFSELWKGDFSFTTVFGFIPTGFVFPSKGFEDHVTWGLMILVVFAFGGGRIAIDYFMGKRDRF